MHALKPRSSASISGPTIQPPQCTGIRAVPQQPHAPPFVPSGAGSLAMHFGQIAGLDTISPRVWNANRLARISSTARCHPRRYAASSASLMASDR